MHQKKQTHLKELGSVSKMKILMLLDIPEDTGSWIGRYYPLAKNLSAAGHDVLVLMPRHNMPDEYESLRDNQGKLKIVKIGRPFFKKIDQGRTNYSSINLFRIALLNFKRMIAFSLKFKPYIVFLGKPLPVSGTAATIMKLLFKYKLILDCDDLESVTNAAKGIFQYKVIQWFEDHVPKYADIVTTHSSYLYNRLSQKGVIPEKLHIIPNGVDEERFAVYEIPLNYKHLLNIPVILYIGDLNRSTGHSVDLLIRALPLVRKTKGLENSILLIVGDGKDEGMLKELFNNLNLKDAVIWADRVSPQYIPGFMELADVMVDPVSPHPGNLSRCPLKLIEAAYFGLPIVTSEYGERKHLLPEGCEFVKEGDATQLAKGISRTISMKDSDYRETVKKLKKHGYTYGWKTLSLELEALISSLHKSSELSPSFDTTTKN
jgi:glycosyltransferase involved in cell wall biosynthesis